MNDPRCLHCRNWASYDDQPDGGSVGECRWRPPVPTKQVGDTPRWPLTIGDDWCAQFHPNGRPARKAPGKK